jgi:hypothetical protein
VAVEAGCGVDELRGEGAAGNRFCYTTRHVLKRTRFCIIVSFNTHAIFFLSFNLFVASLNLFLVPSFF